MIDFFSLPAPFEFRSQNQHRIFNSKGVFFKYYGIAFAILSSIAAGLALDLSGAGGLAISQVCNYFPENSVDEQPVLERTFNNNIKNASTDIWGHIGTCGKVKMQNSFGVFLQI